MKILIVGLGSIAQKHILALRKVEPTCEIYALRSLKSKSNQKGVIDVFSYDELDMIPDFIIISNPTHLHRKSIQDTIKFRVPLMIEKPALHEVLDEDINLSKLMESQGVKTYVACNLRFNKTLLFLKKYIEDNNPIINEVNVYCGSFFPEWRPGRDYKEVYSAQNGPGGGIHLELFHEIDYTYWIFGKPKLVSFFKSSKSSIGILGADYAHYLLEYNNFIASITLNFYRKDAKRGIEIIFENDTWFVDIINSRITSSDNNIIYNSPTDGLSTYIDQMKHMINIVKNKEQSINTFQNSLDILKLSLGNG